MLSDFTTNGFPVLLGGSRGNGTFGFEFYAPVATTYTVQRTANYLSGGWITITNFPAGPSNIVSVVDATASGTAGCYRVRFDP